MGTTRQPDNSVALEGLIEGNLAALPELLCREGVLLLVVFGSTAKGKRHPASDLDVAYLFGPPRPERAGGTGTRSSPSPWRTSCAPDASSRLYA